MVTMFYKWLTLNSSHITSPQDRATKVCPRTYIYIYVYTYRVFHWTTTKSVSLASLARQLHRYGEILLVSYGYCTRACGTRANTL